MISPSLLSGILLLFIVIVNIPLAGILPDNLNVFRALSRRVHPFKETALFELLISVTCSAPSSFPFGFGSKETILIPLFVVLKADGVLYAEFDIFCFFLQSQGATGFLPTHKPLRVFLALN